MAVLGALIGAPPSVAADAGCDEFPAAFAATRFSADGWVDEDGLRAMAGIDAPGDWTPDRALYVENRLLETKVFQSVETRLVHETSPSGGGDVCVLVVELQLKPRITEVNLSGVGLPSFATIRAAWRWVTRDPDRAPPPSEREVRRLIPLRTGAVYEPELVDRATDRVLKRYQASGYWSASVATRVRRSERGVAIDIEVDRGAPRLVTEVELRSGEGTDAEAARVAEEALRELIGMPEVHDLVRQTRRRLIRRLREEGYFDSQVEVTWDRLDTQSGRLSAKIDVGGKQAIVVKGNESVDEADLVPRDELYDRIFLSRNTWRQVANRMQEEYQQRGYYEANVRLEPDGGDIVYDVEEGDRYEVVGVEFEGNLTLDDEALREVVETGRGGPLALVRPPRLEDKVVAEDRERIRVRYVRSGFESAAVSSHVELDATEGEARVRFDLEEGPRTFIRHVEGTEGLSELGAFAVPGVVGEPLDVVALDEGRVKLESELRRKGYLGAQVDFEVERESGPSEIDARVLWRIAPGVRQRISDVVIEGNSDTRYVVITRDLPFETGDAIDIEQLGEVQQEIYDAGVFRNVSIAPAEWRRRDTAGPDAGVEGADENLTVEDAVTEESEHPEERRLVVKVAPRAPGRIAYGAGYDTRQGITGFGELSYANFNRRAQKVRLRGQLGFDPGDSDEPTQYLVTSEFVEPRLLDGPLTYQFNVLAERNTRAVDQYNIERASVANSLSREIAKRYHVGADLQVEFARVFDVLPVPFRERDEQRAWTTSVSPFVVYDGRDSVFDPRSGLFESLRLRYAIPGVSDVDLVEISGQHSHLIPLWSDWGFVYSVRIGWVRSLDGDPIVPIRSRYFIGGGESVRGFAVNSLGPYDGTGSEVGGDLAIVTKTELRIPLVGQLGLVVFVDGGANYLTQCDSACRAGDPSDPETRIRDADVALDNFRTAAGLGLRYVTPIGPVSVDYGIKLDRRTRTLADGSRPKESFGEFSISIGARF